MSGYPDGVVATDIDRLVGERPRVASIDLDPIDRVIAGMKADTAALNADTREREAAREVYVHALIACAERLRTIERSGLVADVYHQIFNRDALSRLEQAEERHFGRRAA